MSILETYVITEPSDQNVLDLFMGEWSSRLPDELRLDTQPGTARLFEDVRIAWAEDVLGPFANNRVLELGPLEGGHSYMLQTRGVTEVVAVEANSRAFLKCLCIKEILKLNRVEYKLGDFMAFLRKVDAKFDLVLASGVLYHMEDPVELIKLISKVTNKIFLWTHYYDKEIIMNDRNLVHKFNALQSFVYDGVSYEYSTQSYKEALAWAGFCGGPASTSKWLTRQSIMAALREFGFMKIQINFDQADHPNGPAFAICAEK